MKGRSWKVTLAWTCTQTCTRSTSILFYALIGVPFFIKLLIGFVAPKQSFRLPDGDLFHCIPIQNLIRNLPTSKAPLRMTPSMDPLDRSVPDFSPSHSMIRQATQLIAFEKRICPTGAVPKRSRTPGIIHFTRMQGRKAYPRLNSVVHQQIVNQQAQNSTLSDSALGLGFNGYDTHKYAVTNATGPYRGTQGRLSIWQPHVQDTEFSLAQVWVSSTDANGRLHSLEAGWQIYKDLYSDSRPRLFVYWTADRYLTTGCYNLHCPGFVQVSNKWLLGGSFAEISTVDSEFQFEIKIQIFKDRGSGDWWLQLNHDNVGYWPRSIFGPGAFNDSNTRVHWGGEIWHRRGHYTDTQMGNGNHPSSAASRRVAFVRNMKVVNCEDNLLDPPRALGLATYPECCDIRIYDSNGSHGSSWGTYAFFGGPGFNVECVRVKPFQ